MQMNIYYCPYFYIAEITISVPAKKCPRFRTLEAAALQAPVAGSLLITTGVHGGVGSLSHDTPRLPSR